MNSDRHSLCLTIYSQYNQLIVGILVGSKVSHCLKKQHSVHITDVKAKLSQLAEDPYPLTSSSNASLQNIKLIVLESKCLQKCSAGS
jgi:hypothetical protein